MAIQETENSVPKAHEKKSENIENNKRIYLDLCKKHNLDCQIETDFEEKKFIVDDKDHKSLDIDNGSLELIVIAIIIIVLIFLWFYFGNGGVLLSSQPAKKKKVQEKPENWQTSEMTQAQHIDGLINQLMNMQDRTQALVILLRHCLIFAADKSEIRLARSDTERTVLRRLPKEVLNRSDLEKLLYVTELAHYGGQDIEEENFFNLLTKGKQFLKQEKTSHA